MEITTPIETEEWGERYFQVTDPNGVVLQLVQWVDVPRPDSAYPGRRGDPRRRSRSSRVSSRSCRSRGWRWSSRTARHAGQRRAADEAPFILHPLEVAHLLRACDYPDDVVAAGVLHDVIEDTDARYEDLEERFGARVTALVRAVSEPPGGGSYAVRKARLRAAVGHADAEAVAVYAADKIAKARELRLELVRRERDLDRDKLDHYWASLALLEHRLGAIRWCGSCASSSRPSRCCRPRGSDSSGTVSD